MAEVLGIGIYCNTLHCIFVYGVFLVNNEWLIMKQREMMSRPLYDYSSLSRSHKRKHNLSLCSDSEAIIHTSTLSPHDEDDGKYSH